MTEHEIIDISAHAMCERVGNHCCGQECPFKKLGVSYRENALGYTCNWANLNIPIEIIHQAEELIPSSKFDAYFRYCNANGYSPCLVEFI